MHIFSLQDHRFDFGYSAVYDSYEPTIVPDECETAYAVAYLLNSRLFDSVLEYVSLKRSNLVMKLFTIILSRKNSCNTQFIIITEQ